MASLHESQAFLDQFDKCLPLCEKGDAVTVINALHTLNTITQGSITQARELDPAAGKDFVCSFLIELELALELYISPSRKLGTIDGGLPALYSFGEEELAHLVEVPSPLTKLKVRKFLEALGVEPSFDFESRGVASIVRDFLKYQVKPSLSASVPPPPFSKKPESRNISWADQCSSGSDSDSDSLPSLAEEASDSECLDGEAAETEVETVEHDEKVDEPEEHEGEGEGEEEAESEHVAIFLWASPSKPPHAEAAESEHDHKSCCSEERGRGDRKKKLGKTDPFFKTRMCKNWEQSGACPFGERCNFAHGGDELRSADAALLLIASSSGSQKPGSRRPQEDDAARRPDGANNYKTKMCKNIEATGACKFGDRCVFAHSQEELRRGQRAR